MNSLITVPTCQPSDADVNWFPAIDVTETEQEYILDVDLPGIRPKEVQVCVDSDGLSISGQRTPYHQSGERVRVERPSGSFVRKLPLPLDARGEIHGGFCDGVLELRVSKARSDNDTQHARTITREPEKTAP